VSESVDPRKVQSIVEWATQTSCTGVRRFTCLAAILTQPDDEGRQHPAAHASRKLTAAERNYPAHVLELLAVVHGTARASRL
jgi:hypothetical protein